MVKHYKDLKCGDLIYFDSGRCEVLAPIDEKGIIALWDLDWQGGIFVGNGRPLYLFEDDFEVLTNTPLVSVYAQRDPLASIPF